MITRAARISTSARLAFVAAITFAAAYPVPQKCQAQYLPQYQQNGAQSSQQFAQVVHPHSPIMGTAPQLPGATNGTIGPPGADATIIAGVNTAGTVRVTQPTVTWPVVAVNALAAILILFVLRRKRADMWILAAGVSIVMLFAGMACGFLGILQ